MTSIRDESKIFSVNQDLFKENEMYEDVGDGRAVDLYKCLLCINTPTIPHSLDCSHVFCTSCIRDYVSKSNLKVNGTNEEISIVCPTCREKSPRTRVDLDTDSIVKDDDSRPSLKSSNSSLEIIQICDFCAFNSKSEEGEVYCSKCSLTLCKGCKDAHSNHMLFRSHPVIHISNKYSVSIYCKKHSKQQSGYYCNDCNIPCCSVCILQDHLTHSSSIFMDAVTQKKEKVKAVLNNLGPQLDKLEQRLKKIKYYGEICESSENGNHPRRVKSNRLQPVNDEGDLTEESSGSLDEMPLILRHSQPGSTASSPRETPRRKRRFSIFDSSRKRSTEGKGRRMSLFDLKKTKNSLDHTARDEPGHVQLGRHISTVETVVYTTVRQLSTTPGNEGQMENQDITKDLAKKTPKTSNMGTRYGRMPSNNETRSWHAFVRLGKTSPIITKRLKPASENDKKVVESVLPSAKVKTKGSKVMPPQTTTQDKLLMVPKSVNIDKQLLASYMEDVKIFRKLYDLAAKSLQMGHAKKVLDFYDLLAKHMGSIADHQVQELKAVVREIHSKVENALAQVTPSASVRSFDLGSSESRRNSGTISALVLEEQNNKELSLLIKPELVWKTEKHKSDPGELWNRCGICFLPNGNIVVAEYDLSNVCNNRLHIYNKFGATVRLVCEKQFCPLGVAVTRDGLIAVTDSKSKRVKIVTDEGILVSEWGKGQFGWPHGLAVNSKGHFIVTDAFNDVISIHQSDGKKIRQFGSSGSGNEHFRNPYHVTVDKKDNIIVSDCGNNCIKAFDMNGEFLFTNRGVSATALDNLDQKSRRLKAPRGVVTDPKGNILVADDYNRVCMFDCKGKYIRNVVTEDEAVKFVEGLAINADGDLAMTECNPAHMIAVKVFKVYTKDIDGPPHHPSGNVTCYLPET